MIISKATKAWIVIVFLLSIGGGGFLWLTSGPRNNAPVDEPDSHEVQTPDAPVGVAIDGLLDGQKISGDVVVQVDIDEPSRVDRVEFYIDGSFAGVTYAAPFSFTFDADALSAGEHKIEARAFTDDGTMTKSQVITVVVEESQQASVEQTQKISGHVTSSGRGAGSPSDDSDDDQGGGTVPDTAAPTTPGNLLLSADDGYTGNLSWTASSDNTGVTGYHVYRDGALLGSVLGASTTDYKDQTVVPGNTYEYSVAAYDAADNVSANSNEPSITLVETSIWIAGDSPQDVDGNGSGVELGVKFRPLVNGKITGIKFYKHSTNTGTHTGRLWTSGGSSLGTVVFSGETTSGWQTATFATPVDVTAGTTYVASYTAPNGHASYTSGYFASDGITSQYLTALANGVDGGNGVYNDSAPGSFPAQSFGNTNYWVDVTFTPNPAASGPTAKVLDDSVVHPGFPGSNNTGIPVGKRLPTRDRVIEVFEANATVENIDVTGGILVKAANVTIRSSKITGTVFLDRSLPGASGWSFDLSDSEVDNGTNSTAGVWEGNFTMTRVNVHGGQHSVVCSANCTVEDSWLHDQYVYGSGGGASHNNAFLSNGGDSMTITGSTLSCNVPGNGTGGGCSGDLSLFGDFGAITNVTIDGNLFTASVETPYCLYAGYQSDKTYGPDAENIIVTNNIFQRGSNNICGAYNHVTNYLLDGGGSPAPGNVWTNNKWDDGTTAPEN